MMRAALLCVVSLLPFIRPLDAKANPFYPGVVQDGSRYGPSLPKCDWTTYPDHACDEFPKRICRADPSIDQSKNPGGHCNIEDHKSNATGHNKTDCYCLHKHLFPMWEFD